MYRLAWCGVLAGGLCPSVGRVWVEFCASKFLTCCPNTYDGVFCADDWVSARDRLLPANETVPGVVVERVHAISCPHCSQTRPSASGPCSVLPFHSISFLYKYDCTRAGSSRSNKPKAGPRKLNLTRISAEKQRAALGLDKNLDDENNDGGVSFFFCALSLSLSLVSLNLSLWFLQWMP